MMTSQVMVPTGSPLIPCSVMISRALSTSRDLPLCRLLETTGIFTSRSFLGRESTPFIGSIAQSSEMSMNCLESEGHGPKQKKVGGITG